MATACIDHDDVAKGESSLKSQDISGVGNGLQNEESDDIELQEATEAAVKDDGGGIESISCLGLGIALASISARIFDKIGLYWAISTLKPN